MIRSFIILLFISLTFTQDGEIVNVQASQRTDGSGIVDISYELLPDDTFPSFDVEAYALNISPHIWYEFNEDGGINVYLNSGNQAVTGINMSWNSWSCHALSFSSDSEFSSNPLFSDWETNTETYWNPGDDYPSMNLTMLSPGLIPNEYTYNGSGEDLIPSGVEHLFLFTITNVNSELWMSNYCADDNGQFGFWSDSETQNYITSFYNLSDERDSLYPIDVSLTAGIGENIFPGVYNFSYQLQGNFYHPALKIRIIASGYIVDSELPFSMVTIPQGTYYDMDSQQQTMDYSYEIMKYEVTNEEIVTWALTIDEEDLESCPFFAGDWAMQYLFGYMGNDLIHINYDGNTLEIESGYGSFPVTSFTEGEATPVYQCYAEYYGLRFPTADEWLYAARGSQDTPLPWVADYLCEDVSYLIDTCTGGDGGMDYCSSQCYLGELCNNDQLLFPICSFDEASECLYASGPEYYETASPFGVYDMIGNAAEVILFENEANVIWQAGQLQFALGEWFSQQGLANVYNHCNTSYLLGYQNIYSWFDECGTDASLILSNDCWGSGPFDSIEVGTIPSGLRLVRTVSE